MSTITPIKKDEMLDRVLSFIASNGGSANVRQILANCYANKNPDAAAINATHRRIFADARFIIAGDGADAVVTTANEPEQLQADSEEARAVDESPPIADGAPVWFNDEPAADPVPDIDTKPVSAPIVEMIVGYILTAAAGEGGNISVSDISKRTAAFNATEIDAAIDQMARDGLVDCEAAHLVVILESSGWKAAMALAKKMSDFELAKKDDEISAYRKRVQREKELADEIQACESSVEAAKARVSVAKDDLATANEKLAAFVRGDVQTTFLGDQTATAPSGEVTAYEQGLRAYDPKKAAVVNPYPSNPQRDDWQRGYDSEKARRQLEVPPSNAQQSPIFKDAPKAPVRHADDLGLSIEELDAALLDDMAKNEIRIGTVISAKVLPLFERDYLVIDAIGTEPELCRYLAVPLYRQAGSNNEWGDMGHEAKYGRCVEGIDQTEDAKATRQTGGEFCGKVVKVGRKKSVVGPLSDAVVIVCAPKVTEAASDEPGDDDGEIEEKADTEHLEEPEQE